MVFNHVGSEGNKVAHKLAQMMHDLETVTKDHFVVPVEAFIAYEADLNSSAASSSN